MSKYLIPGETIRITVGGKPYMTVIDATGIQRFPKRFSGLLWDHGALDLNQIASWYRWQENVTEDLKRGYAEFMMDLGYSVSGFAELSTFQDWSIDNPLWDPDAGWQHELTLESGRCIHGLAFGSTCTDCHKHKGI